MLKANLIISIVLFSTLKQLTHTFPNRQRGIHAQQTVTYVCLCFLKNSCLNLLSLVLLKKRKY